MLIYASKAIVLYEPYTYGSSISDIKKHASRAPCKIDNYSQYADFKVEKVEDMYDYPESILAVLSKEIL